MSYLGNAPKSTNTIKVQRFSGNGATTTFSLSLIPASENNTQVFVNGVYQQKNTYSMSGNSLIFDAAPIAGADNIEVSTVSILPVGTNISEQVTYDGTTVKEVLDEIKSSGGSALVGFVQSGAGAVPRTVQDKLRDVVSVRDFGAVGDGVTDDTAAIQAAIDYVHASGGGVVFVPWLPVMDTTAFFRITQSLILRPKVSVVGDKRRPKIKNTTAAGGIAIQEIFRPGNFHPDFTEGAAYKDCGTIAVGNTVTLTTPADAASFAVGDQVFVASNDGATAGGFMVPMYGFLNIITGIAGAVLTLREPMDTAFDGKICRLASNNGRNSIPLFFAQDCEVANLDLQTTNYKWVNDSACLNVTFRDLTVTSHTAIYGNTFQRTKWVDCDFYFSSTIGEQSHNSYNTHAVRCNFIYKQESGVTPSFGISIQEFARYIEYLDCTFDMGSVIGTGAVVTTINCQHVHVKGGTIRISSPTYTTTSLFVISTSGKVGFPAIDCVVEGVVVDVLTCARFVLMNGRGDAAQVGNGLRNVRFNGACTQTDAVRIEGSYGNFVQQCHFPTGKVSFVGLASSGNSIGDNYIADGFVFETSIDESPFKNNSLWNNSTAKTIFKRRLRNSHLQATLVGPGVTSDFYDVNVGANLVIRDEIHFDTLIRADGTNGDRTIRWHIYNHTTSTDQTLFSIVIPMAQNGLQRIQAAIYIKGVYLLWFYEWTNALGTVTRSQNRIAALNLTHDLSLRVEASIAGTNTSISAEHVGVEIRNPYFDAN